MRLTHATAVLGLLLSATGAFGAPDLFVEKSKSAPDFMTIGGVSFFLVKARNQGDVASGAASVRLRIDESNDGSWEHTLTLPLDPVQPRARAAAKWRDPWTPIVGSHRYELCVDPDGVSGDGDLANNCVYQEFAVGPATVPSTFDVMVYRVKLGRAKDGQPMTFRGGVKNVGSVDVNSVESSVTVDAGSPTAQPPEALRAEARRTVRFPHVWTATAGVHTFELCAHELVNPYDNNPDNDCVSGSFVVGNP